MENVGEELVDIRTIIEKESSFSISYPIPKAPNVFITIAPTQFSISMSFTTPIVVPFINDINGIQCWICWYTVCYSSRWWDSFNIGCELDLWCLGSCRVPVGVRETGQRHGECFITGCGHTKEALTTNN